MDIRDSRLSDNVERAAIEADPRFGEVQVTRNIKTKDVSSIALVEQKSSGCTAAFAKALMRNLGIQISDDPTIPLCQDDSLRARFQKAMTDEGYHVKEIPQPEAPLLGLPPTALIAEREKTNHDPAPAPIPDYRRIPIPGPSRH